MLHCWLIGFARNNRVELRVTSLTADFETTQAWYSAHSVGKRTWRFEVLSRFVFVHAFRTVCILYVAYPTFRFILFCKLKLPGDWRWPITAPDACDADGLELLET